MQMQFYELLLKEKMNQEEQDNYHSPRFQNEVLHFLSIKLTIFIGSTPKRSKKGSHRPLSNKLRREIPPTICPGYKSFPATPPQRIDHAIHHEAANTAAG